MFQVLDRFGACNQRKLAVFKRQGFGVEIDNCDWLVGIPHQLVGVIAGIWMAAIAVSHQQDQFTRAASNVEVIANQPPTCSLVNRAKNTAVNGRRAQLRAIAFWQTEKFSNDSAQPHPGTLPVKLKTSEEDQPGISFNICLLVGNFFTNMSSR